MKTGTKKLKDSRHLLREEAKLRLLKYVERKSPIYIIMGGTVIICEDKAFNTPTAFLTVR